MSEKQVSLVVQNWQSDERVVYLRLETLSNLRAKRGDILAIRNSKDKVTYARCKPTHPDFVKANTIAMNEIFRNSIQIALGDMVDVRKARPYEAKTVTFLPLGNIPPISEQYVAGALEFLPIRIDDIVTFPYFGGDISLRVTELSPEPTKDKGEVATIVRDTDVTLAAS